MASMAGEQTTEEIVKQGETQQLAQMRYRFSLPDDVVSAAEKAKDKVEFLRIVEEQDCMFVYDDTCKKFGWAVDSALRTKMSNAIDAQLKVLSEKIVDAEENLSENDVREALLAKAQYYAAIGDKANAIESFATTEAHPKTTTGQKMDIVFSVIRIGLFWGDLEIVSKNIEKAKVLIELGGDWERRNRLKVYEAMFNLCIRNFKDGALLLLDSIATFSAYELFDYDAFVFYAVSASIVSLDRSTLKTRVIDSPEVLQVIHNNKPLQDCVNALYDCEYKKYFTALVDVADQLKRDRYLATHVRYFIRETRHVAYQQFLESYKTVQLASMAASFGVGEEFLDKELGEFVCSGRLSCKIDKVNGIVESNRPDSKNSLYQNMIKQGDTLLNRIQKLSRVITI